MKITDPIKQQQLVQEIRDLFTSYGYENIVVQFNENSPKILRPLWLHGAVLSSDFENANIAIRITQMYNNISCFNPYHFKKSFSKTLYASLLSFGFVWIGKAKPPNQDKWFLIELMNEKEITYILDNTPAFEQSCHDVYLVARETSRFPTIPVLK